MQGSGIRAAAASGRHSVGAGVRQGCRIVWVIGAIKAVVVKAAAGEMFAVDAVHVTGPEAADMTSADTADVSAAEATDVSAADTADVSTTEATDVSTTEATHVSATEAADVASTEATYVASAATMATATAAAAACLRARGQKAAGKHCTCQNHHHSLFHRILLWEQAGLPPTSLAQTPAPNKDTNSASR
jgi:hypothetical protein